MNKALRVVAFDEEPAPRRTFTVTSAASDGGRRDLLVAMRARVAIAVEDPNTPARDLAALTRRLMEIAKDIEALDAKELQEGVSANVDDERFDASAV